MTVLVTGAGGFVGQNLIPYLHSNEIVTIPSYRQGKNSLSEFLEFKKISDSKIDAIIHLAGKAHDLKNAARPEEYYQVNTGLSKKLFDAFVLSEAKVFVMLSSVKASRDSVNDIILTEEITPEPGTVYGKSKLMAEEYIMAQRLPADKKVFILRPCMIHGPGNKGNLNLLYRFVTTRIPYPLAAFTNSRSFLSIDNLCFVIRELCLRTDIESGVYQVADNNPLSTNQVIRLMGEELSLKTVLWRIPEPFIRSLAKIGDKLKLPLNSHRLAKLTENYVVSNHKLITALKKELPISSEEGLRLTIQSFLLKK